MAESLLRATPMAQTIFLLSPAHCGGKRATLLLRPEAAFDLAVRLRTEGASIGEVFAFLSGLYFRGKLAYAERFGARTYIITTNRGLLPPETPLRSEDVLAFGTVDIDPDDPRYRAPLAQGITRMLDEVPSDARFVLLGSLAHPKYVEVLTDLVGTRLHFPEPFPGMGDMQRGALLLRAAREGNELPYQPVAGAVLSRATPRARRAR